MKMEAHIQLLGILHIVYSALAFIAGGIIFLLFLGIGAFVGSIEDLPEPAQSGVPAILLTIGFVVGCVFLLLSIPGIVGGIGLLNRKEWARILVLVIGFFDLLHIPLGTILGVYTIWVLFNNDAIRQFRQPATVSA